MSVTCQKLLEHYPDLLRWHSGPVDTTINQVSSPRTQETDALIFIGDEEHAALSAESKARGIIVNPSSLAKILAQTTDTNRCLMVSDNVQLAMAKICRDHFPDLASVTPFAGKSQHPSAVIADSAEVHPSAVISPFAVIGENVKVGAKVFVGAHTIIEAGATIGERTRIYPHVYIGRKTEVGADCEIKPQTSVGTEGFGFAHDAKGNHYRLTHYGRVRIENRVCIGSGVQIDRGTFEDTVIGEGTIIDNHCHFAHNVKVGRGCVITAGLLIAGSSSIGNHVVIGGRTTVTGHLHIADGVQLAGLSGVSKSITQPGKYGGYPLQPLSSYLRSVANIPHLPEMRKDIARLNKRESKE